MLHTQTVAPQTLGLIQARLVFFDDVDLAEWPLLIAEPNLTFDTVKKRITAAVKPLL